MSEALGDALTACGLDEAGVEDVIATILTGIAAADLADDMSPDQARGAILHAIRKACEKRSLQLPGYYRPSANSRRPGSLYGDVKVRI